MDAVTQRRLESYWAARLARPVSQLREPGLHLGPHPNATAIYVVDLGGTLLVQAPPHLHAKILEIDIEQILDPGSFEGIVPAAARVIGPAFVGYSASAPRLERDDLTHFPNVASPAFESLKQRVSPEHWAHANLDSAAAPIFAVVADGRVLAAAGSHILLDEVAHIGVVTHPDYRGQGHARRAVAAAAGHALDQGLLAQYQTLESNHASMAVAEKLGFERFATTLALRWESEGTAP